MSGGVVLVVGSGGREHSLTLSLASCPDITSLLVCPGNAGSLTAPKTTPITLPITDHKAVVGACKEQQVELVVVGPEDPLAHGLANSLTAAGIKVFGPSKEAARIESDKSWAKSFMTRHNIPTAAHQSFTSPQDAKEFINKGGWAGYAVKASGLSAGKGVIVADTTTEACQAVDTISGSFGAAGQIIVVEEKLVGEEISVLCFTDGRVVAAMPPAQDHKRLKDGDEGPNTGGMGAYCPCPLVSQSDLDAIKKNVLQKAVDGLREEGIPFVGVLYAGLMLTSNGPKVLEFNCRFGDPETQVILPLLQSDLYSIMRACVEGRLGEVEVSFNQEKSCVGVCVVSGGYPGSYPKGKHIEGVAEVSAEDDVQVIHAGTKMEGDALVTSGGRVLAVVVLGSDLKTAAARATQLAECVTFEGATFRRDIAARATSAAASRCVNGGVTYKDSGVDISAGDAFVAAIKEAASATTCPGVMGRLGSFGGLFDLRETGFQDPILVSGADGVGTKLKIAQVAGIHDSVGQDLVAMCVNDVLVHGARPLFFLDYYATGRLNSDMAAEVVKGVARACSLAGCALIGGETAEMPGMYTSGEYDLAGFTVGAVERTNLLPRMGDLVAGDVLVGLPSSGLHSNGFSLVRRIVDAQDLNYNHPAPFNPDATLGAELLTPTRIYSKTLEEVLKAGLVKAAAHITGGGLIENLPRVLPEHLSAHLQASQWCVQPVFGWVAAHGVSSEEMARTFNCGLGMVLVVGADDVPEVLRLIPDKEARCVGHLVSRNEGSAVVVDGLEEALRTKAAPIIARCPALTTPRRRVAVLISGTGTNLQALLDHTRSGLSGAVVVLVVSNVPGVAGLCRAQEAGVATKVVPHKSYKSREEFEAAVMSELVAAGTELICLAGFMRILTGSFVRAWRGRLLNIHPSLLPAFKGMHAQRQALQAGTTVTGCTVHFVSEEVDCGAIVTQEVVPILPGDTEDILVERIKAAEHKAYPRAMELVARGKVVLGDDGKCIRHPHHPATKDLQINVKQSRLTI